MKVAVTGGAGYIGSVACHRLVNSGADVLVIDNMSQGHVDAVPEGAVLACVDITDQGGLTTLLGDFAPDAVLHFAALTIAPESVRDPAPFWHVNACGTLSLLNAMRTSGISRLIFSSTAAVYGTPEAVPIPENARLEPINPYGASKLTAEQAIATYADAYGLDFAALRYFNVAGAAGGIGEDHRPETHLIPNVIESAIRRRGPLAIYGADFPTRDGTAIRDYVHVEDLIDAHMLALDHMLNGATGLGVFNLGTREGASVKDVVASVERVTGREVPVSLAERRPGDPPVLIADATRAREVLGWLPERSSLDEMVSSAWQWQQQFPSGYAK